MKKLILLSTVLIAMTITTHAQIPNSGFELWNNMGNYMEPQDYQTMNPMATGTFYPVTRATGHYPSAVGSYSIRIENNLSLLPNPDGIGIVMQTTNMMAGPEPSFPITGHPTSFTGYYKFIPQGNDTMHIQLILYQSGTEVAWATLTETATVSNWTSFNIPISSYTTADEGSIVLASFYANGPNQQPHGNSVLYVDNLNFDNLITSIPEQTVKNNYSIYPNPASDIVTLNINNTNNADFTLTIYNLTGELISSETLKQNQQQINVGDLSNGIYIVEIKTIEWTEKQKIAITK